MIATLEQMSIDIFIKGLPSELSRGDDLTKPASLDEAYEEAVRLETRMEAKIIPSFGYRSDNRSFGNRNNYLSNRGPNNHLEGMEQHWHDNRQMKSKHVGCLLLLFMWGRGKQK